MLPHMEMNQMDQEFGRAQEDGTEVALARELWQAKRSYLESWQAENALSRKMMEQMSRYEAKPESRGAIQEARTETKVRCAPRPEQLLAQLTKVHSTWPSPSESSEVEMNQAKKAEVENQGKLTKEDRNFIIQ